MENKRSFWGDNVWSKVIAGLIVALIVFVASKVQDEVWSQLEHESFEEPYTESDFFDEDLQPDPTTLIIHSMTITDFPAQKANGKKWDAIEDVSNADVMYDLYLENQKVDSSIEHPLNEMSVSLLPQKILVDYTTTKLKEKLLFKIYDKDIVNHDYVDAVPFTASGMKMGENHISLKSINGSVSAAILKVQVIS